MKTTYVASCAELVGKLDRLGMLLEVNDFKPETKEMTRDYYVSFARYFSELSEQEKAVISSAIPLEILSQHSVSFSIEGPPLHLPCDCISKLLPDDVVRSQIEFSGIESVSFLKGGRLVNKIGEPAVGAFTIKQSQFRKAAAKYGGDEVSLPILTKEAGVWAKLFPKDYEVEEAGERVFVTLSRNEVPIYYGDANGIGRHKLMVKTTSLCDMVAKQKNRYAQSVNEMVVANDVPVEFVTSCKGKDGSFYNVLLVPFEESPTSYARVFIGEDSVKAHPDRRTVDISIGPKGVSKTVAYEGAAGGWVKVKMPVEDIAAAVDAEIEKGAEEQLRDLEA